MDVIIDGGVGDESLKLGGRRVLIRGGYRRNEKCVYRSAVVGGEAWR